MTKGTSQKYQNQKCTHADRYLCAFKIQKSLPFLLIRNHMVKIIKVKCWYGPYQSDWWSLLFFYFYLIDTSITYFNIFYGYGCNISWIWPGCDSDIQIIWGLCGEYGNPLLGHHITSWVPADPVKLGFPLVNCDNDFSIGRNQRHWSCATVKGCQSG